MAFCIIQYSVSVLHRVASVRGIDLKIIGCSVIRKTVGCSVTHKTVGCSVIHKTVGCFILPKYARAHSQHLFTVCHSHKHVLSEFITHIFVSSRAVQRTINVEEHLKSISHRDPPRMQGWIAVSFPWVETTRSRRNANDSTLIDSFKITKWHDRFEVLSCKMSTRKITFAVYNAYNCDWR
eukprot:905701_1